MKTATPFATNLRALMDSHLLSEADLSRNTKFPQPTLNRFLTGKIANPKPSTVKALANYFNVTPHQLLGNEPMPGTMEDYFESPTRYLPLLSMSESVRYAHLLVQFENKKKKLRTIPAYPKVFFRPQSFAVKMEDESMKPVFLPKDILLITPGLPYTAGCYVLANLPHEPTNIRTYCKRSYKHYYLKAENDVFASYHMENDLERESLIGVVVQSIRDHAIEEY